MPSYTITFKPNPESMQIGTGSYTIPANKFAFVSAVQGSAAFEVDGNTVLNATSVTKIRCSTAGGGVPTSFTVPAGHMFDGYMQTNGATVTMDSDTIVSSGTAGVNVDNIIQLKLGPGAVSHTVTGSQVIHGYTKSQTESPWSHWVPEGTMITGGRWVASIFPQ